MSVKISELLPAPARVMVDAEKSFNVKGIPLNTVVLLVGQFRSQIGGMISEAEKGKDVNYEQMLTSAPELVMLIIAHGANVDVNDTHEMDAIRQLPAGVQLAALAEIWRLTLPDSKKLQELLTVMAASVTELGKAGETLKGPRPMVASR